MPQRLTAVAPSRISPVMLGTAVLCCLLAAGCSGPSDGSPRQLTAVEPDDAALTVVQRWAGSGLFTEGAYSVTEVRTVGGDRVARVVRKDYVDEASQHRVQPGNYRIGIRILPCPAACPRDSPVADVIQALEPVAASCRAVVRVPPATSVVLMAELRQGAKCTVRHVDLPTAPSEVPMRLEGTVPSTASSQPADLDAHGLAALTANSPDALKGRPYRFNLYTHCGADHNTDFDGSFWRVIMGAPSTQYLTGADEPKLSAPRGTGDPYDIGTMTLVLDDLATYRSATGRQLLFVRGGTSTVIRPCR